MEHIPEVRGNIQARDFAIPVYKPITYGEQPLGFQGFRRFPENNGYDLRELQSGRYHEFPSFQFLQSWLFFGLLTETFGGPATQYNHKDFVTDSGEKVTTRMIAKYAWYWKAKVHYEDREDIVSHGQEVTKCLQLANKVLNQLTKVNSTSSIFNTPWSSLNDLFLSLITLGEYLCSVHEAVIKFEEVEQPKLKWYFPFLKDALLNSGWCEWEIATMGKQFNSTCLYYLSMFDRKQLGRSHSKCSKIKGCQALQINYSTYQTRHANMTSDCNCKKIGPAPKDITNIIADGGIPLLSSTPSSEGVHAQLRVSQHQGRRSIGSNYVAISHVWSDGLGNPHGNWLQRCQLDHIQKLVNGLYSPEEWPIPFWMDTICVPVQPEYNNLRQAAIAKMATIYKSADKVLIIDNSLQSMSSDLSWVEMLMRIVCCPWATRVWTLQEARLGHKVFFQFKDKAIYIDEFQDSVKRMNNYHTIFQTLGLYNKDELMRNLSSKRLVQAMATYEEPPYLAEYAVDNSIEADLRHNAIDIRERNSPLVKAAELWMPWLVEAGIENTDADEYLRADLSVFMACTVTRCSIDSINRIRGWGYAHLANVRRMRHPIHEYDYDQHTLFLDVCNGFRGRTTSRLEDEPVCIGILLQTNVANEAKMASILDITPIDWRLKNKLEWLDSQCWIRYFLSILGLEITQWTQLCQEKRMKAIFTQMSKVPSSIIFWDVPRLRFDGWKWAPKSILQNHLQVDMFEDSGLGLVGDKGLKVRYSGFKLSCLPYDQGFAVRAGVAQATRSTPIEILVIHTTDDQEQGILPWRRSWQRLRLKQDSQSNASGRQSWNGFLKSGIINSLIILLHNENGVLVRRHGEEEGCCLTKHVELVEKVTINNEDMRGHEVHVFGKWVTNGIWCVG